MKTLESRYICGYLSRGLMVLRPDGKTIASVDGIFGTLIMHKIGTKVHYSSLCGCKLILRPLSDLYRPITHNGREIVPIVELARIYNFKESWIVVKNHAESELGNIIFGFEDGKFWLSIYEFYDIEINQFQLFDYLHELKIDYRGLIDAGLAIDANTLENNPYK
jgi:hypothetical protein